MSSTQDCLIIAGEKSGEELAMSFLPELRKRVPHIKFFGVGGDSLLEQKVEILYHLKDFSSMGVSDVIKKIPFYKKALDRLEAEAVERKIKVAILIDFQDFNLRLARRLARHGVKVLYYVAPQAWIWKSYRAKVLSEVTHTLFTLLPFEKDWFTKRGVKNVISVQHPLLTTYHEQLKSIRPKEMSSPIKILLLPGSRHFEVEEMLPIFIDAIKKLKDKFPVEVHLVKVNHLDSKYYARFEDVVDQSYSDSDIQQPLKDCHLCLATSGTVTLTTGLFSLPTVVCYKSTLLNEFIFRNFVKYHGPISLTNIILGERVYPEYIQGSVVPDLLANKLENWIRNSDEYAKTVHRLEKTKDLLAGDQLNIPEYMSGVFYEP